MGVFFVLHVSFQLHHSCMRRGPCYLQNSLAMLLLEVGKGLFLAIPPEKGLFLAIPLRKGHIFGGDTTLVGIHVWTRVKKVGTHFGTK